MEHTPDPSDATRFIDAAPVEQTPTVEPPPSGGSKRTRTALIGTIAALSVAVVATGVVLATQAVSTSDTGDVGAPLITASTTPAAAEVVVAPSSMTTTDSVMLTSTQVQQAAEPPAPAQPVQPTQQPQPAADETTPQDAPTGVPTIPPNHVDSCAYPAMRPTVVSSTTYTPAPTPTVTAVTSPQQCPPYSAGYPWDGQ